MCIRDRGKAQRLGPVGLEVAQERSQALLCRHLEVDPQAVHLLPAGLLRLRLPATPLGRER
eukprot:5460512-Alexandrium_andersonii.AAC.1